LGRLFLLPDLEAALVIQLARGTEHLSAVDTRGRLNRGTSGNATISTSNLRKIKMRYFSILRSPCSSLL
jgi:hypothetical protein